MLRTWGSKLRAMGKTQNASARATAFSAQKRRMASGHDETKVNMWEAPTQFAKWKTEHLVLTIIAGYGLTYLGVKSYFSGGSTVEEGAPAKE